MMKVWLLHITNRDPKLPKEDYVAGVYDSEEKAVNGMWEEAIMREEPALLLIPDRNGFVDVNYHYPDYEGTQYIIEKHWVH